MSATILTGIWPWVLRRGLAIHDAPVGANARSRRMTDERQVRVRIDMDRLHRNLAPHSRARATRRTLRRWLKRSGFRPHGDVWLAPQARLGQLAPSEILEIASLD